MAMASLNFAPSTVWTGDNLSVLRGMNSACMDLIYLDPPFNSNRNYEAPIGSKAAGTTFKDAWTLNDIDVDEHGKSRHRLSKAVDGWGVISGEDGVWLLKARVWAGCCWRRSREHGVVGQKLHGGVDGLLLSMTGAGGWG